MSLFSIQSGFTVYITCEHQHAEKMSNDLKLELEKKQITLISSFSDYSFKTPLKNRATRKFLQTTIDDLKIDIIHILFGSPQPVWLNGLKRVKKVITTRGSDVLLAIPGLNESTFKIHLKYLYEQIKKAYNNADLVTCTSIPQKEKLQKLGFRKEIKIIKTGVDVETVKNINSLDFLPKDLVGENIVFSPRYMTPVYNVEYQIEAIQKLPQEFLEKVKFVFIKGRNTNQVYYDSLVAQLEQIAFLSYKIYEQVSQNEIWSILKYSKVAYMVPKSDGTPNSAMECMAVNTPLIMGDLNYDEQLFKGVCLTAKLNDPSSLADCIQQSIFDYPNNLLKEGQIKVEEFGNRSVEMTKLQDAYTALLK
jgi:glycosyltransferase involved in cell wall biosynthesis